MQCTKKLGVSIILNSLNKDYDQFVQNYNMHSMGKTLAESHAMLKLHEKGIPKKAKTPTVLAIREGKIQKDKKKPQWVKGEAKGNNKLVYAPKTKIPPPPKRDNPANDSIYHYCKEVGHWRRNCSSYHAELKKRKNAGGLVLQGLRESKKLKHGALSLYMENGMSATVEAIRSFDLILPSGLIIVLDNCHFAPTVTRGVVSISRLVNNCGPFRTVSIEDANYFITFTDDFSRYGFVYLMKHKHEVFETFKGYSLETAARILNMVPSKKFNLMVQEASGSHGLLEASGSDVGLELIQEDDTQPSENTSEIHDEVMPTEVEAQNVKIPIRKSARIPQAPYRYGFYVDVKEYELGDLNEPPNYKAALSDRLKAMNTEIQSMKDNQVWVLVDLPPNGQTVGSKGIFKKKTNMDGNVHTFKARLVAKGYSKTYGVNYGETFSPVANIRAIRIFLAIDAFYD
ncbi:zinc finger, CCHC-type containing protein [Tanacetum coccineum]